MRELSGAYRRSGDAPQARTGAAEVSTRVVPSNRHLRGKGRSRIVGLFRGLPTRVVLAAIIQGLMLAKCKHRLEQVSHSRY